MFQKVLVALDRTEMSAQVLEEAIAIAQTTGAKLTLLHVFSFFDPEYADISYQYPNTKVPLLQDEAVMFYLEQWQRIEQVSQEYLQIQAEIAKSRGVEVDCVQKLGRPEQVICEVARNLGVDVIVMGHRGRKGVEELVLGSVSNYVLHHAHCSVLTVYPGRKQLNQTAQTTA